MNLLSKKVRVISYRPHQVVYTSTQTGKTYTVPRGRFERRLDLGFYEVENPEMLPRVA